MQINPRILTVLLALGSVTVFAQVRQRADVPLSYQWNLADLYSSDEAWRGAKDKLATDMPKLRQFEGKLTKSAAGLASALDTYFALRKDLGRLSAYASMKADQDTRDAGYAGMNQSMDQMDTVFREQAAFIAPEILKAPKGTVDRFLAAEPKLKPYAFYVRDIIRQAPHTLSSHEQELLASAGLMSDASSNTFNILSNADFPYPTVTLSDGKAVRLNQANFAAYRSGRNRQDREKVMAGFFGALGAFSGTFGTTMNGQVRSMQFYAKARNYSSSLEASLSGSNIPVSVYTALIDGVNAHLPTFHRYLKLRQRMMGLNNLHYYDLYAPLVSSVNLSYEPEQAQEQVLEAVAPLGETYVANVRKAFAERWIDLYPTPGKVSGAYSQGSAYDVHPYMSINYNGAYTDLSTLAHEMGHSMHSYLANHTQPYATARYSTFVAEVASTFNENLLLDHVLKATTDRSQRLSLLGNYLENVKSTVFRQAQFAEFELRMHELAQKGQAITGDVLAKLYLEITRKYYGHDQNICVVDDYIAHEWSYVPHFYRGYYVFQYATSFTASAALAQKVLSGDPKAAQQYLSFLSAGGSKYPVDLLKEAGVDMTTSKPLDDTVKEMNRVMDEIEALLPAGNASAL